MPFVYAASMWNCPWLRLRVGDSLQIVDSETEARIYDANGKVTARYEAGTFFKGLARPWMGLHTIDVVRRDAAEKQVWFGTKHIPGSGKAEVVLTCEQTKLVYGIDMETDVVEKITFSASNGGEGELAFSYLQDTDDTGDEFAEPSIRSHRKPQHDPPGMLWLVELVHNRW